jgi:hypothetical protein
MYRSGEYGISSDPRGGWVGQRPKKDQGQIYLLHLFMVFLNSPHQETPQNVKKNREKIGFGFWSNCL